MLATHTKDVQSLLVLLSFAFHFCLDFSCSFSVLDCIVTSYYHLLQPFTFMLRVCTLC